MIRFSHHLVLGATAFGIATTVALGFSKPVSAFTITVGDNDGYGFGVPDNGTVPGSEWPGSGLSGTQYDGRSASETSATNGAQITDVYSSIFPAWGPNSSEIAQVIFPLSKNLLSAQLVVDMGDFQASTFGAVSVFFNGVLKPNLFNFEDGFRNTAIRTFQLDPIDIANANANGEFVLTINHTGSNDFVAFDYFELQGEDVEKVPEPSITTSLLVLGVLGVTSSIKRKMK